MLEHANKFERKVWDFISTHSLISQGQTVGVAVSGGADSMALLVSLQALGAQHDFSVKALHYEHGIRGKESLDDASFVSACCKQNGIELLMESGDVPRMAKEKGIGTELAAREARRTFFESVVKQGKADLVATAHHQGDNAESVLLHVLRGAGLDGLCGIAPQSAFLIRPLLCVNRPEIELYLNANGISWVQDSTNFDVSYDRNYVRSVLLPAIADRLNPGVQDALCRLATCAIPDAQYLTDRALEALEACEVSTNPHSMRLNAGALSELHPAIAGRVIRLALGQIGRVQDIELVHVETVLGMVQTGRTGSSTDLGKGARARLEYGQLVLETVHEAFFRQGFEIPLQIPSELTLSGGILEAQIVPSRLADTQGSLREYVDADKIPPDVIVRTRRPGDRIRPLHAPGGKKLKDYFIDRKLPRDKRDSVLLVASGSNILWIIGHVLSDDIRVDNSTKRICRLTYRPKDDVGTPQEVCGQGI